MAERNQVILNPRDVHAPGAEDHDEYIRCRECGVRIRLIDARKVSDGYLCWNQVCFSEYDENEPKRYFQPAMGLALILD